ncbi:MAG: hypothetical protein SGJ00_08570 [bacterium]|nr:hypothetical protein [bacterium]
MKKLLYVTVFLMNLPLVYSQEGRLNLISTSPTYTRQVDFDNLSFPLVYPKTPSAYNSSLYLGELKVDYSKYKIPLTFNFALKNNYYLLLRINIGEEKYQSELNYTDYTLTDPNWVQIENVNATFNDTYIGLGKALFLGADKKLMVMPHLNLFTSGVGYDRDYFTTTKANNSPVVKKEHGYAVNVGLGLGLNVNYQLSKHFGFGLTFTNLLSWQKFLTSYGLYSNNIEVNYLGFNIDQMPRFQLNYYFNPKKKSYDWLKLKNKK